MSCSCSCSIGGDYYSWLNVVREHRARKNYRCCDCGMQIARGEVYVRHSYADDDGNPTSSRYCIYCNILIRAFARICGCFPDFGSTIRSNIQDEWDANLFELPYEIRGVLIMRMQEQIRQWRAGDLRGARRYGKLRKYMRPPAPTPEQAALEYSPLQEALEAWFDNKRFLDDPHEVRYETI